MALVVPALLGLIIGSFLNVVAHRLPRGESLVSPGSRCTSCGHAVRPWDNLPLLSWLLLRGRCRHCGERISPRYPALELLTGVVFTAVVLGRGLDDDLAALLPFAAVLIAVAAIDLEHRIVPNKILLPAAVWAVASSAVVRPDALPELLVAGAGAFVAFLVAAVAHPAGMGMGDVKLAGVMGFYLGVAVIPALLVAFAVGALVGAVVMVREGAGARKKGVPFAPFLALGGLVGLIVGPELVELYADRFL